MRYTPEEFKKKYPFPNDENRLMGIASDFTFYDQCHFVFNKKGKIIGRWLVKIKREITPTNQ